MVSQWPNRMVQLQERQFQWVYNVKMKRHHNSSLSCTGQALARMQCPLLGVAFETGHQWAEACPEESNWEAKEPGRSHHCSPQGSGGLQWREQDRIVRNCFRKQNKKRWVEVRRKQSLGQARKNLFNKLPWKWRFLLHSTKAVGWGDHCRRPLHWEMRWTR